MRDVYKVVEKFPINAIQRLPDYPNRLDERWAFRLLVDFSRERWEPITIDPEHYLLDGQHRLWVAERMALSYVDVIIDTEANAPDMFAKRRLSLTQLN
ncbi:hypothetical protein BH24DEI2_BH24DEI2_26990 [soil metagenome]